jgi:hypothetical protein
MRSILSEQGGLKSKRCRHLNKYNQRAFFLLLLLGKS